MMKTGKKVFPQDTMLFHALGRHDILIASNDILLVFYPNL
jgi:hypothetical protein